ncbi:sigma-70 family RNA polymerase sigma factor [Paraclostridium sordellii]|uniref:RNA polymerase sigma-70 factor n=1 Tax=Paraclostridium sordellii TaxID=1505 RepID=A0A9P1L2Q6_PARSO|nr:sigma-70 family RNA polymerase sigma factor [Paeniclostridium sordellii]MCH1965449.1 sigma-70 family RNA polymerase sigma factor [Paeniclostridium sordellii]MCQ4696013.1 sigma-70 family RNA polymerase sigma factor [Paeniclostridium sordellii]MDU4412535.1 sigma-70 family RNA polymerase sigma factor [Paeniclostridium sordellii]MRZ29238.1 sigma-70 family RNA polymerase sigma factor [Paeniclostridium sordellii]MVO73839.1 sigma-70 family RNA polymerase sigma factor [Paeniclostridium sordellii]
MIKSNILNKVRGFDIGKELSVEETLIKQSQWGNDDAFEKLIDRYEGYLYKMAFLYVKNEQDAMDIYQETVLKAYLNITKLKDRKAFKTWITKILVNNVYTKNNQAKKVQENHIKLDTKEFNHIDIEEKIDLYDAIDILEEKYRTPIILQYFYDLTTKQISEITNFNENTIKTNIRRGKKKIYEILKEEKDV